MPIRDTLHVCDSISCRLIVLDRDCDTSYVINPLPVNNLWNSYTLSRTKPAKESDPIVTDGSNFANSGITLGFFILIILFIKEIVIITPVIIKTLFSYKNHVRLEQKLSDSNQRNIAAILSALFYPVFAVLILGDFFSENTGLPWYMAFGGVLGFIFTYWIYKSSALRFVGWITKVKQPFALIGKIGYNHLIISVIFSIPAVIVSLFFSEMKEIIFASVLSFSVLFASLLYLFRTYQSIISYRFSHFFYILYLCIVEILPLALLTHFLLSFQ
ncbi:MAG: DUF4271 domain-containing protein [Bacteroidales bacterium]